MRNIIAIILITIGIICGITLFNSVRLDANTNIFDRVSETLLGDIYYVRDEEDNSLIVSFSHNNFFYEETINVSIKTDNPEAIIFYTTDGSNPTESSDIYFEPIELAAGVNVSCTVLKAVAQDTSNGIRGPVLTQSYFVGKDVSERFSTMIFSISGEPDDFFGYDNGILVKGRLRDEWIAENPDSEVGIWSGANFRVKGRESERLCYVEVIDENGKILLSQAAGARVHGAMSRAPILKSLKLYARREYGKGRFRAPLFGHEYTAAPISMSLLDYDTLILANGGSDYHRAFIRTQLVSKIISDSNLLDISNVRSACVFINGEYYGFRWLMVDLNEQFFETKYQAPERSFDVYNNKQRFVREETESLLELVAAANDIEERYRLIAEKYDISNLLMFHAVGIYICRADWPDNHVELWRYTGDIDSGNAKELDGRWRHIMWDLDSTLWITDWHTPDWERVERVMYLAPLLGELLKHPKLLEEFTNYLCDMAAYYFSADNVKKYLDSLTEASDLELRYSIETLLHDDIDEEWHPREIMEESRGRIIEFCEQRAAYLFDELRNVFGYTDTYTINVSGPAMISTNLSGTGKYFVENKVPVKPNLKKHQVFDYWVLNQKIIYEEELIISASDAVDGVVNLVLYTNYEYPPLTFTDSYDYGDICGFSMMNKRDTATITRGLYLSDDINNLKRWSFPALTVTPGTLWDFVGENSTNIDSILKIGLNFNPRFGETIFLSDEEGNILDYISVK